MNNLSFYIFFCLFCCFVDFTICNKEEESTRCKEATSILETVMFFPITICDLDIVQKDSNSLSGIQEYTDRAVQLLKMVKTGLRRTVKFVYSNISPQVTLAEFQQNLQTLHLQVKQNVAAFSHLVRASLNLASLQKAITTVDEHIKKLTDLATGTGSSLTVTVQRLKVFTESAGNGLNIGSGLFAMLLWGLCDLTMSVKAFITALWTECSTTLISSPGLCLRYTFASLLAISLPYSFHRLVKDIPNAVHRSKIKRPSKNGTLHKTEGFLKGGSFTPKAPVSEEQSTSDGIFKLPNFAILKDFVDSATKSSYSEQQYTEDALRMYHYKMCEIYDGCKCNCGGRSSPISVRIHNASVQHGLITKFTLKPAHYPMCEYFDTLPCNCDGYLRKSPVWDSYTRKVAPEKFTGLGTGQPNFKGVLNRLAGLNKVSKVEENLVQDEPMKEEKSCMGQLDTTDHELNSMSMFTEVSMLEEFEADIGHPKFNSSFKEESPHASVVSDSAYSDEGCGDGPMLVITRRSPKKECGISFEADEDGPSSFIDDSAINDDEDSLLDVSDISRNLSYSNGDGVYEFVVLYTLQTIYRTTKRIFRRNVSRSHDQTHSSISDISRDTYFVLSKRKSRSKRKKQPKNRNLSARSPSVHRSIESDSSEWEDSFTDNDRPSDLSSYHGNISREQLPAGYGSWSLSSSKDDSSIYPFLKHNKEGGSLQSEDRFSIEPLRIEKPVENQRVNSQGIQGKDGIYMHTANEQVNRVSTETEALFTNFNSFRKDEADECVNPVPNNPKY